MPLTVVKLEDAVEAENIGVPTVLEVLEVHNCRAAPGATNPLIIPAAPAPTAKVIIPPDRREEDILLKTAMISRSPKRRTDPMFFFLN